ncbi:MAG: hypothetical protein DMF08_02510 [Verrucomicrobia bacterium]|nr:MAG: hypothetical protein DMF08_02510 [Verrucomicrobiota bacterium]
MNDRATAALSADERAQRANIEIKSVMKKHSITGPSERTCFSSMIGMVGIFPMVPSEDISRSIKSVKSMQP